MKLSAYLEMKGVAVKDFAACVGVDQSTVRKWLKGETPRLKTLMAIRRATSDKVTERDFA